MISKFVEAILLKLRLDNSFANNGKGSYVQDEYAILSSDAAWSGYIISIGIKMFGKPEKKEKIEEQLEQWEKSKKELITLIKKIEQMSIKQKIFFSLSVLLDRINSVKKESRIVFFEFAFSVLYEEIKVLTSFEVCWNSYQKFK